MAAVAMLTEEGKRSFPRRVKNDNPRVSVCQICASSQQQARAHENVAAALLLPSSSFAMPCVLAYH